MDRGCGQRACRATGSPSRTCSRRPRCREYLGLPLDFGDRVDLGGATAAGMVWRAAAAVELGLCDAVLAVVPGSTELPRSERTPGAHTRVVRGVEQQLRLAAGRVRDPVRQRRPERPVRADRAALRRRIRLRRRGVGQDRRATSATNACAHPGAVFHGKPITVDDVLNSPMIADPIHMLETVMRVQGGAGVLIANADVARRRPAPAGVDQGLRRAHPVQDAHLRRRPDAAHRSPAPPRGRSRWRDCSGPTSTWRRSTTATRSPC